MLPKQSVSVVILAIRLPPTSSLALTVLSNITFLYLKVLDYGHHLRTRGSTKSPLLDHTIKTLDLAVTQSTLIKMCCHPRKSS